MEKIILKLGSKAPIIIAKALAGDPASIAILVAIGGIAIIDTIKKQLT